MCLGGTATGRSENTTQQSVKNADCLIIQLWYKTWEKFGRSSGCFLFRLYSEGNKISICTEHDTLRRVLSMADPKRKLVRWRLHSSEPEVDTVRSAGIKKHAGDPILQVETGGMDTTELDNALPEMLV